MLLLTNCEVHTGKYSDRSFEVRTERSEFTFFRFFENRNFVTSPGDPRGSHILRAPRVEFSLLCLARVLNKKIRQF